MKRKTALGVVFILALLVGIYLYAHYDPSDYGFYPKCMFHFLTGYDCPGCGSQRALYNVLHGHFIMALRYNPLVFVAIPYIFTGIYIEYLTDRNKPNIVRMRAGLFSLHAFFIIITIIAVFTIVRNIWHFSPQ